MHILVPRFILERFAQNSERGSFQAAAIFVDASGFTAATEALMQHGQHGAEVMANLMSGIFAPLVDSIYGHGGFVAGFAGDAFTAVFPMPTGENDDTETLIRTVAAAYTIQQYMRAHAIYETVYGTFKFSVKVGIGSGDVQWGILAGAEPAQHTYYFKGSAVDSCAAAEHFASGGDVILSRAIAAQIGAGLLAEALPETELYGRLSQINMSLPEPQSLAHELPLLEQAVAFHDEELIQREIMGEFRQVFNLFISLDEIETHEQLVVFMQELFALQSQYGGFFNRIDFGDKGCNALLFFGAPVAHENDIERVVNFVLDLQAVATMPLRAGLTYRISHAGFVGAPIREEYTCYGRGVNLAARHMMGAPWGEIWIDEQVAQRIRDEYELEFIGRLPFKGFSEEQPVYKLLGRKEVQARPLYERPLIGREVELAQLVEQLRPLTSGEFAGVIVVQGDAGSGKSHVLYALRNETESFEPEPRWFHAPADEIIRESLNPFRYWLRAYFRQSREQSEQENQWSFDQRFERLLEATIRPELRSELIRTRSFLVALAGLTPPESSLYAQLDPLLRFRNMLLAVRTLLQAESLRRPVVLEIEDAQWLDADSPQLLRDLATHLHGFPVALVIASREPLPAEWFDTAVTPFEISLNNLGRVGIKTLMQQFVDEELNDSLVDFVTLRTDGNPFFVEQVMLFFQEQGLLDSRSGVETLGARFDVPTDIRSVLVSRLDRLMQDVKQVVQTAAVLGREFEVQLLSQMINGDGQFAVRLETATEAAIWLPLSQIRYIFKHGLMRDAAYNMQIQARLRELHRLAATSFETLYEQDFTPYYGDLAYHYGHSGPEQREKTLFYLDKAAQKMQADYANEDALRYYRQALELEERWAWQVGQIDVLHILGRRQEERLALEALESMASVPFFTVYYLWARFYEVTGDYEAAEAAVYKSLSGDVENVERAEALSLLGLIARRQGHYDKAKQHYSEALPLFGDDTFAEHEHALVYCRLASGLGTVLRQQGELEKAKEQYEQALFITQKYNFRKEEAEALNHLGVTAYYKRNLAEAENYHQQALQIRQVIGDKDGIGMSLLNLAPIRLEFNDYNKAQQYFLEALAIWQDTGNRWEEINTWNNLGILYQQLGNLEEALNCLQRGLAVSREIGDEAGQAYILANLGLVYHDQQNLVLAEETFKEGQTLAEPQNDLYMISYFVSHRGMVGLDAADYTQALALAEQALQMRREIDLTLWTTADLTTLAAAHLALRQQTEAERYAQEALAILDACQGQGPEFPQRDYFICYEVLRALRKTTAARAALQAAYQLVMEKAEKITAEDVRRSFLGQVPIHQQIVSAYASISQERGS